MYHSGLSIIIQYNLVWIGSTNRLSFDWHRQKDTYQRGFSSSSEGISYLDHGIIFEKTKLFGFPKSIIKYFEFYQSNVNFLVCFEKVFSRV